MDQGIVLDLSNREFQDLVFSAAQRDIMDSKYEYASNSKANRFRQFLKVENDFTTGLLLEELAKYWLMKAKNGDFIYSHNEMQLYDELKKIIHRLKSSNIITNVDAFAAIDDEKDFAKLAKNIRESIERNEPELALDRLHTFLVKFVRSLCRKHSIDFRKEESLNSIFGRYIKMIVTKKALESTMTEKILKYSVNIIESFNNVRNNKSLAHDNTVLNYNESLLIFENISALVKFINILEEN